VTGMTWQHVDALLTLASITDHRTYGPAERDEWHRLIGHLDLDVAREALTAVQTDTEIRFMQPRDLLRHAAVIRRRRERIQSPEFAAAIEQREYTFPDREEFDRITAEAARARADEKRAREDSTHADPQAG
jgi:hypothetical protein